MREDWIADELGKLFFTTSGGTPPRKNANYYRGNIPWVKSGELDKGVIYDTEEKISELAVRQSSAKIFPKGTLLIALYGATIGKLAFLGVEASTNQAVCGIYMNGHIEPYYLYYYILLNRPKLISQGAGGAQPNISQTILKKLELPFPSKPEQRAIVSKIETLFSDLDNGIADLKKAQEQLKIYRQAVLKKAFEGELTQNRNIEWVNLGTVCKAVEYGTSSKSNDSGLMPVLRMGNIQNGRIDWSDLKFTTDTNEIEKYKLNKDDVLFNRTNRPEHVGKTAIFKGERDAIFAGYLIRINYNKDFVVPDYLNYYLNSHTAKQYGNRVKSFGVNQSNINGTKLKQYPFPKTTIREQQKILVEIESRLSVCDKVEENIAEALKKSEALRQSILKRAFDGRLLSPAEIAKCKQEADYEPASELLKRIKSIN